MKSRVQSETKLKYNEETIQPHGPRKAFGIIEFVQSTQGDQAMTGVQFRYVMGHFATGIVVAATLDEAGAPAGLTCNSVTSVSLDPPLVLFCVDRDSTTLSAFLHSRAFTLSILREEDEAVSRRFATGEPGSRFVETPTRTAETGMPILASALAWLDCDLHETVEAGDHRILLGRVRASGIGLVANEARPLLYFLGKYRTLGL